MEISEKVAYLKGLAEGLALDTESKEGKLIAAIIDVLDDMSGKFEDLEDELCDVEDGLDILVRTKAAPLPGLTCWNSTTVMILPSYSKVLPFLKSPAVIVAIVVSSHIMRKSPSVGAFPRIYELAQQLYST